MKLSKHYHNSPVLTVKGKDCYELAQEWKCTPEQAAQRIYREGWFFSGYNDCGEECYLSPEEEQND